MLTSRGGSWVDWGPAQPLWALIRWLAVVFLVGAQVDQLLIEQATPRGEPSAGLS